MAGYSGTPLAKKLGIKAASAVALIDAPDRMEEQLAPLPEGVRLRFDSGAGVRTALLFVRSRGELSAGFDGAASCVEAKGHLWIAWPKKASGVVTDVKEDFVREYGLARMWVDFKVCAIDEVWSGLCFARR
jgi:hypothetical protein